ncbi:hypothetical protein [Streptomyces sp. TR02-1]
MVTLETPRLILRRRREDDTPHRGRSVRVFALSPDEYTAPFADDTDR